MTGAVALAGLPPVYELGLRQGLAAVGLAPVVLGSNTEVAAFADVADEAEPRAVVLPASQYDTFWPAGARTDGDVAVVVVLTDRAAEQYAEALRLGATGAVVVDAPLDEVVDVVVAALRGRTLLPTPVANALARSAAGAVMRARRLRPEEVEWLRHLADSSTVATLARSAGYSEREMYRLLAALYRRMGARNRTEALLLAQQWGVLATPDAPARRAAAPAPASGDVSG